MLAKKKKKSIKKHTCILLLFLTSFAALQCLFRASYAAQSAWSLDLLVQSAQAVNQNRSNNVFAPFEEIQVIARVTYNMDPRPNIGVSFEIKGPLNSSHPTIVYRTATTSTSGIAIISLRLPPSNQSETEVLGEWQVFSSAAAFPEPVQANMTFTVKETGGNLLKGSLELSVKHVYNGSVTNQTSNVFAPFEEVQLTANVSYGDAQMAGAPVAFEVSGPLNSSNPMVLFRSAIADEEGIATISFRIPMHNQTESPVLGMWEMFSSAIVFGDKLQGNLTFEVKWPVEISKIRFLDSEGKEQTRFTKEKIAIQLTLNNTDLQPRDVNVTIDFRDYLKNSTVQMEIQNVPLNGNETVVEREFNIPLEAAFGEATVECSVYSGNYSDTKIQVAETKTATFIILNRDVAVTEARLSATEIYTGDPLSIIMNVTNKGSETENLVIQISHDQILIGNLTVTLIPLKTAELTHTWNTSDVTAGTYEITVQVVKLPGEIEVEDNQVTAGTVTINYPPINPQTTSMFVLLLVITGLFTFASLLLFLRKRRNTFDNIKS
jgi:hypothetical protein